MRKGALMTTFIKFLVLFFLISIASSILMSTFDVKFGVVNYWDVHGIFFLLFMAIFPRLTLLFSSVAFGGIFWWLGFFFCPRLLVAILATFAYWQTNPILVCITWLFVIGGESTEKVVIHRRIKRSKRYYHDPSDGPVIDV